MQTYKHTKALMDKSFIRNVSHQKEMSLKTQSLRNSG